MKANIYIEIDFDSANNLPVEAGKFSKFRARAANAYVFSDANRVEEQELISFLEEKLIGYQRFYTFSLARNEIAGHPGFYFGADTLFDLLVDNQVSASQLGSNEIALDYESGIFVVAHRVATLLESTSGVMCKPVTGLKGKLYSTLEITGCLPDPIEIQHPVEIAERERPAGTYAIRSDGRDHLSPSSVEALRALGIARAETVRLPDDRVLVSPRRLISGIVLDALISANVRGLPETLEPLLVAQPQTS